MKFKVKVEESLFYILNYIASFITHLLGRAIIKFQDYVDYLEISRFAYWRRLSINNFSIGYTDEKIDPGFNLSNFRYKFSKVLLSFEPLQSIRGYTWDRGYGLDAIEFRLIQNEYRLLLESDMPYSWYYGFYDKYSRTNSLWYANDMFGSGLNIKQLTEVKRGFSISVVWFILAFIFLYIPFIIFEFAILTLYTYTIRLSKFISVSVGLQFVKEVCYTSVSYFKYLCIFLFGYCIIPFTYFFKVVYIFVYYKFLLYRSFSFVFYSLVQPYLFNLYRVFNWLVKFFFNLVGFCKTGFFSFCASLQLFFIYFQIFYTKLLIFLKRIKIFLNVCVCLCIFFSLLWFYIGDNLYYPISVISFSCFSFLNYFIYYFIYICDNLYYPISVISFSFLFLLNYFIYICDNLLGNIETFNFLIQVGTGGFLMNVIGLGAMICVGLFLPIFRIRSLITMGVEYNKFFLTPGASHNRVKVSNQLKRIDPFLDDVSEMVILESVFHSSLSDTDDVEKSDIFDTSSFGGTPLEYKVFSGFNRFNSHSEAETVSGSRIFFSRFLDSTSKFFVVDPLYQSAELSGMSSYRSFIKEIAGVFSEFNRSCEDNTSPSIYFEVLANSRKVTRRYYNSAIRELDESNFTELLSNQLYLSFSNVPRFEPIKFEIYQSMLRNFYFFAGYFNNNPSFSIVSYYLLNLFSTEVTGKSRFALFSSFHDRMVKKFVSTFYFSKISEYSLVARDGFFYDSVTKFPGVNWDNNNLVSSPLSRSSWFLEDLATVAHNLLKYTSDSMHGFSPGFDLSNWFSTKSKPTAVGFYNEFISQQTLESYRKLGTSRQILEDLNRFLALNSKFYFSYSFSADNLFCKLSNPSLFFFPFWVFKNTSFTDLFYYSPAYADVFADVVNHSTLFAYANTHIFHNFFPHFSSVVENSARVTFDFWKSINNKFLYDYKNNWGYESFIQSSSIANEPVSRSASFGIEFRRHYYYKSRFYLRKSVSRATFKFLSKHNFTANFFFLPHWLYFSKDYSYSKKEWRKLKFFKRLKFHVIFRLKKLTSRIFFYNRLDKNNAARAIISRKSYSLGVLDVCLLYYFVKHYFAGFLFYKFVKILCLSLLILVIYPIFVEIWIDYEDPAPRFYEHMWSDSAGYSKWDWKIGYYTGLRIYVGSPGISRIPVVKGVIEQYNQKTK